MISFNKKTLFIATGIVLGGAALSYAGLHREAHAQQPAKAKPTITVMTTKPIKKDVALKIEAFGNIQPWQEFSVAGDVTGYRITEIKAEVGDKVKKGQVLARFNDEYLRHERAQLAASLEQAIIKSKLSSEEADRYVALDAGNAAAKQDIANKKAQAGMDKASVAMLKAQLANVDTKLKNSNVIAPDDGTVSSRSIVAGTFPAQGGEMFRIIRQGRLEWRAEVPAKKIEGVKEGAKSEVVISGKTYAGKVRKIAPLADEKTRSFIVYVDAAVPAVSAGTYASGNISIGIGQGLFVPSASIRTADGRATLPVVDAKNGTVKVKRVIVETGAAKDGMTEVRGIDENVFVVTDGAGFLNDGDVVSVKGETK